MEEEIDVGEPMYAYSSYPMEEDGPIDMSMKKRPSTQESSYHLDKAIAPPSYFEHNPRSLITNPSESRPSVITCISRQVASQSPVHSASNHVDEPSYPPPPYNVATQMYDNTQTVKNYSTSGLNQLSREESPSRKRQVVQTETLDPEIEEHFRRSLGQDYQELLVKEKLPKPQEESNDSVDDHFTKALGGLWNKLKAENNGTGRAASPRSEPPPPYQHQPWKPKYPSTEPLPPPSYPPMRLNNLHHDSNYPLSLSPKNSRRDPYYLHPVSRDRSDNPNVPLSLSPKVSRTFL